MSRSLRFHTAWFVLGVTMIAVVIAASLLAVSGPVSAPGIDKIYHLIAYGALMFWWGMVQPGRKVAWAVGLLLLGTALEFAQTLTGYRTLDRWDALANSLGVLLALLALFTPLAGLLTWFDRQLADRLDPGAP